MRRREFILLVGAAAAAALPSIARTQNAARTARVGYLTLHPPGEDAAFTDGLNNLGWTEGRNITIDRRICSGDIDCLEKSAVELASLKLDVIVAVATLGVQAIRNATTSIPIVMDGRRPTAGTANAAGASTASSSLEEADTPIRGVTCTVCSSETRLLT
jgi:putative ABC transport system substrate-binding protein